MIQQHESIEKITMENTAESPELARTDLMNIDTNNLVKTKAVTIQTQEEATNTHTKRNRSDTLKDQEIINKCKLEVQQASDVMTRLEKDIKKLEAFNQVLVMVRRNLNRTSRTFWDSSI